MSQTKTLPPQEGIINAPTQSKIATGNIGIRNVLTDVAVTEQMVDPTEEEVIEYANWLGLDLKKDIDLIWIARQALIAPLSYPWVQCETDHDEVFFYNQETRESVWDHPLDQIYLSAIKRYKKGEISKSTLVKNIRDLNLGPHAHSYDDDTVTNELPKYVPTSDVSPSQSSHPEKDQIISLRESVHKLEQKQHLPDQSFMIDEYQTKLNDCLNQMNFIKAEVSDNMANKIKQLQNDLEQTTSTTQEMNSEIFSLKSQLKQKEMMIDQLAANHEEDLKIIRSLELKMTDYKTEQNKALTDQFIESSNKLNDVLKELDDSQLRNSSLEKQKDKLSDQVSRFEKEFSRFKDYSERSLMESSDQFDNLRSEIQKLNETLEDLSSNTKKKKNKKTGGGGGFNPFKCGSGNKKQSSEESRPITS